MKVSFNINFYTIWGQSLYVLGSIPELGKWEIHEAKVMECKGEGNWTLELELPDNAIAFEYRYFMKSNDKIIFEEWNINHSVVISDVKNSYYLFDYWQSCPQHLAYFSSAFTKSLFAHPCDKFERVVKSDKKVLLKVLAPRIEKDCSIAITGNQEEFGNWDVSKALILSCDKFPLWSVEFDAKNLSYPIEYKFVIIENKTKSIVCWEAGENRLLNLPLLKKNETAIISGLLFKENSPDFKCAGLVIPVFSLRSFKSFGIGDFSDLKDMITWAKLTTQKIIQILPINDTTMTHTWMDSYPYNAISIYALHPLYLSLQKMGELKDKERGEYFSKKQLEINQLETLDYELVSQIKWDFFHEIFKQEGKETLSSEDYLNFFEKNKNWLVPYAAYSYLRDKYHTSDFTKWDKYSQYNKTEIENLTDINSSVYSEIVIYYFLQYHLDKQLAEVRSYAHANGIVLKGDIPIGISKSSIEAWTEPRYFNMHAHAGAPPDDFSVTGQNWGFPTYNWSEMENDDYEWWKKRFRKMSDYFDAYRIDHILGFFRIWEIPENYVQGLCGTFNPAIPFTINEMENAGLNFNKERFTSPHINECFLPELFGEYTSEVCNVFLQRSSSHHFSLKEKYDTQKKIQSYFSDKTDSKSIQIREGLYTISNEVLFIADKEKQGYHPRISASNSYIYRELNNSDRYAFDYLYWNYFYQKHNDFWKEQGYKRLIPLISYTNMLVCGEDLGMIPQSVPEVMAKLQIFSLEIERMPKESNVEFTNLKNLRHFSVCTTSTHDMSTIRGWWKENWEKTQRYYNQVLHQHGEAPENCTPELCEQIVFNHLLSPSMLTILPLQDWLSTDGKIRKQDYDSERINIPANPRHYWRYRMHLSIEDLINNQEFIDKIKDLIAKSGRA